MIDTSVIDTKQLLEQINQPQQVRILLIGSPGTGKTMVARELARLVKLNPEDAVTMMWIYFGAIGKDFPFTKAPFRAPHHTVSTTGLVGTPLRSGRVVPGEVSLAHAGTLMLDELPEFHREVIETLAAILDRESAILRIGGGTVRIPAKPHLIIAAANPCYCGFAGSTVRKCTCSDRSLQSYNTRLMKYARLLNLQTLTNWDVILPKVPQR